MQAHLAELFGVAAAAASLYAAQSKTIIPLRAAVMAANCMAMIYSFLHGTYPTFVLNAVLLPVNAWRLYGMMNLVRSIDTASKSDMNVDWLLPYTRPKNFKAGDIMMERGEYATAAFMWWRARSRFRRSTKRSDRVPCWARSACSRRTVGAA